MSKLILEAKRVSKVYDLDGDKIAALRDVSLKIYQGDFLAIIGKSGSGKSTLMHIIGLLDSPSKGRVKLNGENVSKLEQSKLAKLRNKEIGFVFQSFNLLPRTSALDNVELPLKYSRVPKANWRKMAISALKQVGLENRMNNKPNELSGGQKQRVAIARALVNDPSIILADEPTGNLDSKTGEEIVALFKSLNKIGKTIIIVTHDEELASVAKRKIVISDGKIVTNL